MREPPDDDAPCPEGLAFRRAQRDYRLVVLAVGVQGCLTFLAVEAIIGTLGGWFENDPNVGGLTSVLIRLRSLLPSGYSLLLALLWILWLGWLHHPRPRADDLAPPSLALPLALHLGLNCLLLLALIGLGVPLLGLIASL